MQIHILTNYEKVQTAMLTLKNKKTRRVGEISCELLKYEGDVEQSKSQSCTKPFSCRKNTVRMENH